MACIKFGIKKKSFFLSNELKQSGKIIEFVRYSASDGIGDLGSLHKVKYILENGMLKRYSSNFLNSPYLNDHITLIQNVSEVKIDIAKDYSAEDADITFRLYKKFHKSLRDEKMVNIYEIFEKPMIKILAIRSFLSSRLNNISFYF